MDIDYLESLVKNTIESGKPWEGSGDKAELQYLSNLAKNPKIALIGEIGFNAGLSSYTFLAANPHVQVYSFDLGEYDYVKPAKERIDKVFPGRHTLIIGDSLKTVPEFHENNSKISFDLIFVDGGHDYPVAKGDLINMQLMANDDTKLVTDDLTPWKPWGEGPTRAWQEAIREGLVVQQELLKDSRVVTSIEPPGERSWVLGKYIFSKDLTQ